MLFAYKLGVIRRPLIATVCAMATAGMTINVTAADVSVPTGLVAFFNAAQCPDGWTPPTYAEGRLVVAIADTTKKTLRGQQGEPLSNNENRPHSHTYTTTANLPSKSISAASSCCNGQGTAQGSKSASGNAQDTTSELPFTQLVICEKQ